MAENRNGASIALPRLRLMTLQERFAIYDQLHPDDKAFFQQCLTGREWTESTARLRPEAKARYWAKTIESTLKTYGPDHPQAQQRIVKQVKGKGKPMAVELSLTDHL